MWLQVRVKPVRVGDDLTDKGRLFQTVRPETEKKLSLQICSLLLEERSSGWWP